MAVIREPLHMAVVWEPLKAVVRGASTHGRDQGASTMAGIRASSMEWSGARHGRGASELVAGSRSLYH
ncbi:hypothetical protein NPIL_426461 [Nephila pilipes]|uniref:Uncharacterized protein n=1 Tax=Nephila pilipes TaxID=299642 RepID=A0A8X6Q8L4_NEPPI|nr:hypothetical protein NPIL_426461 [Nephila pilipes]